MHASIAVSKIIYLGNLITLWEHFVVVVSIRPGQTLIVDVSFKYRYDTLNRVAKKVKVTLYQNIEEIMYL